MDGSFSAFDFIIIALGVYVLVAGIRGKGRLYGTGKVKEGKEKLLHKTMRIIYCVIGVTMLLNGASSMLTNRLYEAVIVQEATENSQAIYEIVSRVELPAQWAFLTPGFLNAFTLGCMVVAVCAIVVLVITTKKFTVKGAPAETQNASGASPRPSGHILPTSAFEFDDPEKPEEK